ncbi:MAG: SiaB family protein kinase [Bacteroidota bacterium]
MKEIHKFITDRNIIMSFRGNFTYGTVTDLLFFVKKILENTDTDYQFRKKAYAVVVEAMDNITRHATDPQKNELNGKDGSSFFAISSEDNHFKIQTGNLVLNKQVNILKQRLSEVNLLNKDELRSLYEKKLLEKKPQGGGLGIVDISIRSGCQLNYEFIPYSNETSFFILQTILNK